jgi:hypothetical protein
VARRPPDLKRRRHRREPRRRFIIYCEGLNTEPAYFAALRRVFRDALIDIATVPAAGVPLTLAKSATDRARELGLARGSRKAQNLFEKNDQIWAVFDRDVHPHHQEAVALCEGVGVGVGRSNPCFELWLILHEEDFDRLDDGNAVRAYLRQLRACKSIAQRLKGATGGCEMW